jgi:hypothetical protein
VALRAITPASKTSEKYVNVMICHDEVVRNKKTTSRDGCSHTCDMKTVVCMPCIFYPANADSGREWPGRLRH